MRVVGQNRTTGRCFVRADNPVIAAVYRLWRADGACASRLPDAFNRNSRVANVYRRRTSVGTHGSSPCGNFTSQVGVMGRGPGRSGVPHGRR
jgi:hypothetical protein